MESPLRNTEPYFKNKRAVVRFVERLLDHLDQQYATAKAMDLEPRWTMTINSETGGHLSVDCYAGAGMRDAIENWDE